MQKETEWVEITAQEFNQENDVISSEFTDNHQVKYYREKQQ